jgi:hypothetical protein
MEIRTEVEIAAPPDAVWRALTDFAAYQDWNPFLVRVTGRPAVGEKLTLDIAPPGMRRMTMRETVTFVDEGVEIRWGGRLLIPGLADGEHYFRLVDLGGGRTRLLHGERFTGLLVPLVGGMIRKVGRGFEALNQALKQRLEGSAATLRA